MSPRGAAGTSTTSSSMVVKPLKVQPLKVIGSELLKMILSHLKPRYVYKLMQTNKEMYFATYFNDHYWNRVAAHVLLRDHLPLEDPSWYTMLFPKGGYNYAMEEFLKLVPSINTKGNPFFKPDSNHSISKLLVNYAKIPFLEFKLVKEKLFWGKVNSLEFDSTVKDVLRAYATIVIKENGGDLCFRNSVKSFARFIEDEGGMSSVSKKNLIKILLDHFEYELLELVEDDDLVKCDRRIGIIRTFFGVTIEL